MMSPVLCVWATSQVLSPAALWPALNNGNKQGNASRVMALKTTTSRGSDLGCPDMLYSLMREEHT